MYRKISFFSINFCFKDVNVKKSKPKSSANSKCHVKSSKQIELSKCLMETEFGNNDEIIQIRPLKSMGKNGKGMVVDM